MDIESALEQATLADQQGNKARAQAILVEIINREPRNEKAWLLTLAVVRFP